MRVHVTGLFWVFLILLMVWREVTKRNTVQTKLHQLGPLALCIQWYVIFFVGYGLMLGWTLHEMFYYLSYSEEDIQHHVNQRWVEEYGNKPTNMTGYMTEDHFVLTLKVRTWLRVLSWIAVISAPIVFCLLVGQIGSYVWFVHRRPAHEHEIEAGKYTFGIWKVPLRMNMVMLILLNPGVFSVMSFRAHCRVLALVTGTAHNNHRMDWPEEQTFEFALFMGDMELASAFQYFAVHVFARLCGDYLCDSSIMKHYRESIKNSTKRMEFVNDELEYRRMVKWAAFLVVHAFVFVGILRCTIDFIICEGRILTSYGEQLESLQMVISSRMDVVFLFLTILCVINMKLICDMKDITRKLAKASMMFMGTRILLLLSDNQALVIQAFTVESSTYAKLLEVKGKLPFRNDLPDWNFYSNQAHLFHLSLVSIECLLVVAFNIFAWRNLNIEQSEIMSRLPERTLDEELPEPATADPEGATTGLLATQPE